MSGRLRIFRGDGWRPELDVEAPGTVELVFSEATRQNTGLEGDWRTESVRRTIRLGDFDGEAVAVVFEPAAAAEPAAPAEGRELVEVYASGLSHEQIRRYGFTEKPVRLLLAASQAARMRGEEVELEPDEPTVHVPKRRENR